MSRLLPRRGGQAEEELAAAEPWPSSSPPLAGLRPAHGSGTVDVATPEQRSWGRPIADGSDAHADTSGVADSPAVVGVQQLATATPIAERRQRFEAQLRQAVPHPWPAPASPQTPPRRQDNQELEMPSCLAEAHRRLAVAEQASKRRLEELQAVMEQAARQDQDFKSTRLRLQEQLVEQARRLEQAEARALALEAERDGIWERLSSEETKRVQAETQAAAYEREWDANRERLAAERVRRERAEDERDSLLRRLALLEADAALMAPQDVVVKLEGQLRASQEQLEEQLQSAKEVIEARDAELLNQRRDAAANRGAALDELRRREEAEKRIAALQEELHEMAQQREHAGVQLLTTESIVEELTATRVRLTEEEVQYRALETRFAVAVKAAAQEVEACRSDCLVFRGRLEAEEGSREQQSAQVTSLQQRLAAVELSAEEAATGAVQLRSQLRTEESAALQRQLVPILEQTREEADALRKDCSVARAELLAEQHLRDREAAESAALRRQLASAEGKVQQRLDFEQDITREFQAARLDAEASAENASKLRAEFVEVAERLVTEERRAAAAELQLAVVEAEREKACGKQAALEHYSAVQLEDLECRIRLEYQQREADQIRSLQRELEDTRLGASRTADRLAALQTELEQTRRSQDMLQQELSDEKTSNSQSRGQLQCLLRDAEAEAERLQALCNGEAQHFQELLASETDHLRTLCKGESDQLQALRKEETEQLHAIREVEAMQLQELQHARKSEEEVGTFMREELDEVLLSSQQANLVFQEATRVVHHELDEAHRSSQTANQILRQELDEALLDGERVAQLLRVELEDVHRNTEKVNLKFQREIDQARIGSEHISELRGELLEAGSMIKQELDQARSSDHHAGELQKELLDTHGAVQQEAQQARSSRESATELRQELLSALRNGQQANDELHRELDDARQRGQESRQRLRQEVDDVRSTAEGGQEVRHLLNQELDEMRCSMQNGEEACQRLQQQLDGALESIHGGQEMRLMLREELHEANSNARADRESAQVDRETRELLQEELEEAIHHVHLLRDELTDAFRTLQEKREDDVRNPQQRSPGLLSASTDIVAGTSHGELCNDSQQWTPSERGAALEQLQTAEWAAERILEARNVAILEEQAAEEAKRACRAEAHVAAEAKRSLERLKAASDKRERARELAAKHQADAQALQFVVQQASLRAALAAEEAKSERLPPMVGTDTTEAAAVFRQRLAVANDESRQEMVQAVDAQKLLILRAMRPEKGMTRSFLLREEQESIEKFEQKTRNLGHQLRLPVKEGTREAIVLQHQPTKKQLRQLQEKEAHLKYAQGSLGCSEKAEEESKKLIKQLQSQLDAYDRERAR